MANSESCRCHYLFMQHKQTHLHILTRHLQHFPPTAKDTSKGYGFKPTKNDPALMDKFKGISSVHLVLLVTNFLIEAST